MAELEENSIWYWIGGWIYRVNRKHFEDLEYLGVEWIEEATAEEVERQYQYLEEMEDQEAITIVEGLWQ